MEERERDVMGTFKKDQSDQGDLPTGMKEAREKSLPSTRVKVSFHLGIYCSLGFAQHRCTF